MTKRECLTNWILSRRNNSKKGQAIVYGGHGEVCKRTLNLSIITPESPRDLHRYDRAAYNVMYPYCKECTKCKVDDLPKFNFFSGYKYKIMLFQNKDGDIM